MKPLNTVLAFKLKFQLEHSMNYRKLLLLSLPAMIAIGLEPVAGLIDTIFLGQKSALWVTGLGATNSV